jgi:hypothetical protein
MLKGFSSAQVALGPNLTTEQLQIGLTGSGYELDLIGSEYKRLDKSGEFVYTVLFHSDVRSDKPVDAMDVYVNFINETSYEVGVY